MEESQWLREMWWHGIFDAIMPALRDPDRRIPLLKQVEKWSSAHADTIVEVGARGQIEKTCTQMADALHHMAPTQFQRTTATVPAEIKECDGSKTGSSPPSTILPGSAG